MLGDICLNMHNMFNEYGSVIGIIIVTHFIYMGPIFCYGKPFFMGLGVYNCLYGRILNLLDNLTILNIFALVYIVFLILCTLCVILGFIGNIFSLTALTPRPAQNIMLNDAIPGTPYFFVVMWQIVFAYIPALFIFICDQYGFYLTVSRHIINFWRRFRS